MNRDACARGPGCPIRESRDQRLVGSYSELIAASYALHRLPAPRHPPCALSNLTTIIPGSLASARPRGRAALGPGTAPSVAGVSCGHATDATAKTLTSRSGFLLATLPIHFSKNPTFLPIAGRATRLAERCTSHDRSTQTAHFRSSIINYRFQLQIENRQLKIENAVLVEPMGFEPTTSWLQTRRSPN